MLFLVGYSVFGSLVRHIDVCLTIRNKAGRNYHYDDIAVSIRFDHHWKSYYSISKVGVVIIHDKQFNSHVLNYFRWNWYFRDCLRVSTLLDIEYANLSIFLILLRLSLVYISQLANSISTAKCANMSISKMLKSESLANCLRLLFS